ncbi:MAG: TetR/AcrR family transcriptional regulator [Sphingopyxis sp.]
MTEATSSPKLSKRDIRSNEADETRRNILEVAAREFADKGLAGARIDEIADRTNSSKRMIYYYFGGKDELYRAVLEQSYAAIREREASENFDALPADEALRQHVMHTFDYHDRHPEFVRLVMNENIHRADHLKHVDGIKDRNKSVVAAIMAILSRGVAAGLFRPDIDPVDLHMSISALAFYNVSNRHTFSTIFERDIGSADAVAERRERVADMILAFVAAH